MYYGYNIETTLGSLPAYDNEFNVPATVIPNQYLTVRFPSAETFETGSATLIFPIVNALGLIQTADGSVLETDAIVPYRIAKSTYLMPAISQASVPSNVTIGIVMIGILPVVAMYICIAICALAASAAFIFASEYWTSAWVQSNAWEADQAYQDYLLQAMAIISDVSTDINSDDIMDIRTIIWANGKEIRTALSEAGVDFLDGQTLVVDDDGTTAPPPEDAQLPLDFGWVLIAVVGVVGLVIVMKMMGSGQSGGMTILKS